MFDVPVALFIYNRPVLAQQVFAVIRQIQPSQLLIIADGHKDIADAIDCDAARQILTKIDWHCDIKTNFSAQNLGVAKRVSSGLDWVFSQVEQAIILEDDTLPNITFFEFCKQLLDYYKNDPSVLQISGTNLGGRLTSDTSYGFSRFVLPPWGWASWARAWEKYDFRMRAWNHNQAQIQESLGNNASFWSAICNRYQHKLSSWDIQWQVSVWAAEGLTIIPAYNLVENIGYGAKATFTDLPSSQFSACPKYPMPFPLVHPQEKTPAWDAAIEPQVIHFIREIMAFNTVNL